MSIRWFLLILSVLGMLLANCTQSMVERYSDKQICYRTRVFVDGWAQGYRAEGETHLGPYANFTAIRREISLTAKERPYLFAGKEDPRSCSARFPEVEAPLPEFYRSMQGVIPVPKFYGALLAGRNLPKAGPLINVDTLILIGIIAASTGAIMQTPPQQVIILN
ncbi:hypothetical protein K3722_00450 [Leisingera caerulea]|uniref:Lipoprotein n=1 Tax=Leisingera caerulea TaxID=506591 RepID=A0ABY5WWU7_LEICA|nr:hypothetical protein [Leisingera caerulea]UWQ58638.1 hypothetical protein K3722_00450 [Leisingera caerulea]